MTNEVGKAVAFVLLTVGIVALAGPIPTVINGVLVLVLSGVILSRYGAIDTMIQWITNALKGG